MKEQIPELDSHFLKKGHETYLRHISVDCVIFGFHENELKVLLLKWKKGPWCLPGGFVRREESLQDSATRTLQERTGLKNIFLQQFHAFGDPQREKKKSEINHDQKGGWLQERFVTIGYYALVEFSYVKPLPDALSETCEWCDLNEIPTLIMDHRQILEKALEALRLHINYHPVGYNLLPNRFTMPQLQKLYETILGKKLDRRNFQRKMLAYQILKRLKERKHGVAYKSPYLYSFDLQKYHTALKEGLKGGW